MTEFIDIKQTMRGFSCHDSLTSYPIEEIDEGLYHFHDPILGLNVYFGWPLDRNSGHRDKSVWQMTDHLEVDLLSRKDFRLNVRRIDPTEHQFSFYISFM